MICIKESKQKAQEKQREEEKKQELERARIQADNSIENIDLEEQKPGLNAAG